MNTVTTHRKKISITEKSDRTVKDCQEKYGLSYSAAVNLLIQRANEYQ